MTSDAFLENLTVTTFYSEYNCKRPTYLDRKGGQPANITRPVEVKEVIPLGCRRHLAGICGGVAKDGATCGVLQVGSGAAGVHGWIRVPVGLLQRSAASRTRDVLGEVDNGNREKNGCLNGSIKGLRNTNYPVKLPVPARSASSCCESSGHKGVFWRLPSCPNKWRKNRRHLPQRVFQALPSTPLDTFENDN